MPPVSRFILKLIVDSCCYKDSCELTTWPQLVSFKIHLTPNFKFSIMKFLTVIMFSFYFLFASMVVAIPTPGITCWRCPHLVEDEAELTQHILEAHPSKSTFYYPLKLYVRMIDLYSVTEPCSINARQLVWKKATWWWSARQLVYSKKAT
jgi:hypothetical protein